MGGDLQIKERRALLCLGLLGNRIQNFVRLSDTTNAQVPYRMVRTV